MTEPQHFQKPPQRPTGLLAGACYDALHHVRTLSPAYREKNFLGHLSFDRLDGLDAALLYVPAIASEHAVILKLIDKARTAELTADEAVQLRSVYESALDIAFPTTQGYLKWCWAFHGLTQDHSLETIQLPRLQSLEVAALIDTQLRQLLKELQLAFGRIKHLDDIQGFRQAYEVYGEALVYALLKEKFSTERLAAKDSSKPDFACTLPNGKRFFVELKSLDIVDGGFRSDQMRDDAMASQIELEHQQKAGARISITHREIAPFKRAHDEQGAYDPTSLLMVIETFIAKARSAFKPKQFAQGPTIAFALCDRLLIPGGKHSVVPEYIEQDGAKVSGVLWHASFGREGNRISSLADALRGTDVNEVMSGFGLLTDPAVSFPTGAIVFAETFWQEDRLLGLYDATWSTAYSDWTPEDTREAMHTLCTTFNDSNNSFGHLVDRA